MPPVNSRTTTRSTPSMTARLSVEASMSSGKTRTGRRLANRPRLLRSANSACSGRTEARGSSHLGPPTAPSKIASALLALSSTSGRIATPWLSIEAPPIRPWSRSVANSFPDTARRASTACSVTSWPIPSPGRTRMLAFNAPPSRPYVAQLLLIALAVLELVQGVHERERARHDDVGVCPLPRHGDAVLADQTRDLALRVRTAGDRVDPVALELQLDVGDLLDRLVTGIDHAVPGRVVEALLTVDAQLHGGVRYRHARGRHVQIDELIALGNACRFLGHERQ